MRKLSLILIAAGICITTAATAEEPYKLITPQYHEWLVYKRQASNQSAATDCLMGTAFKGDDSFQFAIHPTITRVSVIHSVWSLPEKVEGKFTVILENYKESVDISSNSKNQIYGVVDRQFLDKMTRAMLKSIELDVFVGKERLHYFSLIGSAAETNAFRQCAGLEAVQSGPDPKNPFK